jgi:hypothetical protein
MNMIKATAMTMPRVSLSMTGQTREFRTWFHITTSVRFGFFVFNS